MAAMLPDGSRRDGGCRPTGSASRWDVNDNLRAALLLAIVGFASLGFGCSALSDCDTSDDGNPPDPYYSGTTVEGSYMSSEWTGPLLPFTGGKRYDFYHGLGCAPMHIECWVSFNANGIENGSIAPPAGNMCVIQDINDEYIRIKNDTCSEMYVMLTASTPTCDQDAGATDAAIDDSGSGD
jgi:hypothetical protein